VLKVKGPRGSAAKGHGETPTSPFDTSPTAAATNPTPAAQINGPRPASMGEGLPWSACSTALIKDFTQKLQAI